VITRLESRIVTLASSCTDSENYFRDCVMKQRTVDREGVKVLENLGIMTCKE
jgi:hypothetical protein